MTMIDLTQIPAPDVVETLDFESIYARRATRLQAALIEIGVNWDSTIEADPLTKVVQADAYEEMLLRVRVNDAARAVMLTTAMGSDLDNLAAWYGVERLNPESDDRLRTRTQMALEGFSTAGPKSAYTYHALSASPLVADVDVSSPQPGQVVVTILSTAGDGLAGSVLLETVSTALNAEDVRPLNDHVVVQSATIRPWTCHAVLTLADGPAGSVVIDQAIRAVKATAASTHRIGAGVYRSALIAALHQPGVIAVDLIQPATDLEPQAQTVWHLAEVAVS